MVEVHFIRSIDSPSSGISALQREHALMQISGRSLLVSDGVSKSSLTLEFQSKPSAILFRFFANTSALLALMCMQMLIYERFNNVWFYKLRSV